MADTIDIQNANEWLAEVQAAARELVNVLKGGIDVGQTGELGDLALINTLADAPVGDAAAFRQATGTEFRDFGVGVTDRSRTTVSDLNDYPPYSGIYHLGETATPGAPTSSRFTFLSLPWDDSFNSCNVIGVEAFSIEGGIPSIYHCSFRNGTKSAWAKLLSSSNTTVDANGFIKAASPIFRLANVAEDASGDGFTLDGCGAYNGEAEGVTASHDDVGVYTVSGSLGFATEGWTIEIPQDVNGNRLCFVETETADDGTITVRTFGRRFDYETAMIVAGDPIDIPDGRWIDLRLSMPQPAEPDDSTEQEPAQ